MFHTELTKMFGENEAGGLSREPQNFLIRDLDGDMQHIGLESQHPHLLAYCQQVTRAYLSLNGIEAP